MSSGKVSRHSSVGRGSAWCHTASGGMTGLSFKPHQFLLIGTWKRMAQLLCWLPRVSRLHTRGESQRTCNKKRTYVLQKLKKKINVNIYQTQNIPSWCPTKRINLYRPQKQSCEGYVFTAVCPSTGVVCPIACWDTPPRTDTPQDRHPTPHGQTPPGRHTWADTPRQTPPGQTSGWYASHWNAFLFALLSVTCLESAYSLIWLTYQTWGQDKAIFYGKKTYFTR